MIACMRSPFRSRTALFPILVVVLWSTATLDACSSTAPACDPETDPACLPDPVNDDDPVPDPDLSDPDAGGTGLEGEEGLSELDAGIEPDAGAVDPDPVDPVPVDAGPSDPGPLDAGPVDPGPVDAGRVDPGPVDAGRVDPPPPGLPPVATPPAPVTFPATIDHLSVTIRTGARPNDATDANKISLCLNATACYRLNVADVNDFNQGAVDVFHFAGVNLRRSAVDRVELRSVDGTDAWGPACVSVQFDGEPVYCSDGHTFLMGNGAATEKRTWKDPQGLHRACNSCYRQPMSHGPVVGATGPASSKLWVRTDATRLVGVEMAVPGSTGTWRPLAYAYPLAKDDYAAKLELAGLQPSTTYRLRVTVDGQPQSPEATLKTAPAAGAKGRMKFAFGSCARAETQAIFERIRSAAPDLMIFAGDNHYGNTGDVGGLWANYRMALERGRAPLMAVTPTIATWDDHDFTGNNTDGTSTTKANALRAFRDYWANPSFGLAYAPGVFTKASWGDLDFFLIDDRYERSPPGTSGGHIIGTGQEAWLLQQLSASTATFKFLVSGSNFSPGAGESWLQFPAARTRLFEHIRTNRIPGVVLLSGDIHRSHFRKIVRSGTGAYDLPELVSSPFANQPSGCSVNPAPDATQQACVSSAGLYVQVEADTTLADPTLVAKIIDAAGATRATTTIKASQLR